MIVSDVSKLSEYDFVVVVDKSGSMGETDMPGNRSRWDYMQETVTQLVREVAKFDADGIDLVVFGGRQVDSHQGVTVDKLKEVFAKYSPGGTTPLTEALQAAVKLAGKSDKKDFILVITDGVPDNKATAADVIRQHSHTLQTDDECTFLFVQVGHDGGAAAYLRQLDDDLRGAKFDIVDAKTIDEVEQFSSMGELILHAITD